MQPQLRSLCINVAQLEKDFFKHHILCHFTCRHLPLLQCIISKSRRIRVLNTDPVLIGRDHIRNVLVVMRPSISLLPLDQFLNFGILFRFLEGGVLGRRVLFGWDEFLLVLDEDKVFYCVEDA